MNKKLSDNRTIFVETYCTNGHNATQAYKTAYPNCKGGWNRLGHRLMTKDDIKQAIDEETAKIQAVNIATRKQRQQFWTEVYHDTKAHMNDRLRASELLGKSEADFTENISQTQDAKPAPISEEDRRALSEAAKELTKPKVVKINTA